VREALARVSALRPDLVCVTGDVVDSPATDLDLWLPELARVTAPLGVFTILGNHDRWFGADRVAAALRRGTSWHVLRDEVATVHVGGVRLHLVGLEDDRRAPAAALADLLERVPRGEPAILLAHRPSVFPDAAAGGVRLTLAGHTHGGQLAVPGLPHVNPARFFVTRWDSGTFVDGESILHVNRGLGASGQRVRVGARPEITHVTFAA
jgi:uncharacterized protein